MRQYITSEINKLAHQIHQEFELPWGIAFRLTLRLKTTPYDDVLSPTSVFGNWMPSNTLRLAGHFWGLSKGYAEIFDKGRSIAMQRVADKLYAAYECQGRLSFSELIFQKWVSESVMGEVVDFFASSYMGDLTERSTTIIQQGADRYEDLIKSPRWEF